MNIFLHVFFYVYYYYQTLFGQGYPSEYEVVSYWLYMFLQYACMCKDQKKTFRPYITLCLSTVGQGLSPCTEFGARLVTSYLLSLPPKVLVLQVQM